MNRAARTEAVEIFRRAAVRSLRQQYIERQQLILVSRSGFLKDTRLRKCRQRFAQAQTKQEARSQRCHG